MVQPEKFENLHVRPPKFEFVPKPKASADPQAPEDRYAVEDILYSPVHPCHRRKENEVDVQNQQALKAIKEARKQKARLETLMKNAHRNGILGGENIDRGNLYKEKATHLEETKGRIKSKSEMRRECRPRGGGGGGGGGSLASKSFVFNIKQIN